jgi:hypothetical protein
MFFSKPWLVLGLALIVCKALAEHEVCQRDEFPSWMSPLAEQDEDEFSLIQAGSAHPATFQATRIASEAKDHKVEAQEKTKTKAMTKADEDVKVHKATVEAETVKKEKAKHRWGAPASRFASLKSLSPPAGVDPGASIKNGLGMHLLQRGTEIAERLVGSSFGSALAICVGIAAFTIFVVVATLYMNGTEKDEPLKKGASPVPSPGRQNMQASYQRSTMSPTQQSAAQASRQSPTIFAPAPQTGVGSAEQLLPQPQSQIRPPQPQMAAPAQMAAPKSMPPRSMPGTMVPQAPQVAQSMGMAPMSGNAGMPAVESRFAVSINDLAHAGTDVKSIDIVSLAGLPLLSMSVKGGQRLEISISHQSSAPRCSLVAPNVRGGPFKIHDSQDRPYGKFQIISPGLSEVSIENKPVMMIEGHSATLNFSATSPNGKPVALAKVNKTDFKGDHFEVRALPGSDAVLVLAVLLALAIFVQDHPA